MLLATALLITQLAKTTSKLVSTSENISQRVSDLRQAMGLNQEEFAKLLGISRNYVSMIEGGKTPSDSLILLVDHLWGVQKKKGAPTVLDIHSVYATPDLIRSRIKEAPNNPRELLKFVREKAGLSPIQLAEKIGYQVGVIQAIEDGSARISERMIEKICEALPDLCKEDLMAGSEAARIIGDRRATVGTKPKIETTDGLVGRYVPLISWAQAGSMGAALDEGYEYEGHIAFDVADPKAFATPLRGESMRPQYDEGDVLIVYPSHEARNGDLVIARLDDAHGGDVMFKIFSSTEAGKKVVLSSYNPAYPQFHYNRDDFAWIYPVDSVVKRLKR